jgi:trehalose 6-phosphate phosphatase
VAADEVLERFGAWRRHPERAGVLVDLDGTLAQIVVDPLAARPLPGAREVLAALAARYGVVAVVSGRPVSFLADHLNVTRVLLSGLYGLETWRDGTVVVHPEAERWRASVAAVADRAEAELPAGVGVERKGLSVTFHVRTVAELDATVREWAERAARGAGLVAYRARRSYELRPPVEADKGTVVAQLAAGLSAVCFFGDDRGDLPAFAALDALDRSVSRVRVAVASDEAPPELLAAADVIVDGPVAALELLDGLARL